MKKVAGMLVAVLALMLAGCSGDGGKKAEDAQDLRTEEVAGTEDVTRTEDVAPLPDAAGEDLPPIQDSCIPTELCSGEDVVAPPDAEPEDVVADSGDGVGGADLLEPDLTDVTEPPDIVEPELPDAPSTGDAETYPVEPDDVKPDVPPEEEEFAVPGMSAWVVRKAKFQEPVQVTCRTLSGLGEVIENPGVYEVSFSAPDVEVAEEGYLFPTPGTFEVTCTDAVNGLEGSAEFVVAHDMLSPTLTDLSEAFGTQRALVEQAVAAAKADDAAAMDEALAGLKESRIRAAAALSGVAQTPPGGWPSQATIDGLFDAEEDDAAYVAAVEALAAAVTDMRTANAALAANPSMALVGALEAANQAVLAQLAAVEPLAPGGAARYAARSHWDAILSDLQEAQNAYVAQLEAMLADPGAWEAEPPCPGCFTLGELVVSMAIQYTLSTLPSYNKLLVEAGKCAASMAVMLLVADAIDAAVSGPDAPVIEYNMPGYGNAVKDGSALSLLVTGMDPCPGNNVVLFISPKVGDTVVNAVDAALATMSAVKSLGNWDNVFELGGAIVDAYNALTGDLELMEEDIPGLLSDGVVPMPVLSVEPFLDPSAGFWDHIVDLPPLPECVDGWLPAVGILVPISFTRGNGPAYELVILP